MIQPVKKYTANGVLRPLKDEDLSSNYQYLKKEIVQYLNNGKFIMHIQCTKVNLNTRS